MAQLILVDVWSLLTLSSYINLTLRTLGNEDVDDSSRWPYHPEKVFHTCSQLVNRSNCVKWSTHPLLQVNIPPLSGKKLKDCRDKVCKSSRSNNADMGPHNIYVKLLIFLIVYRACWDSCSSCTLCMKDLSMLLLKGDIYFWITRHAS